MTGLDPMLCEINRTATAARQVGANALEPSLLATYRRRYDEPITAGWAANSHPQSGQRGKRRRPKHVTLIDRLDTHRDEVVRCAEDLRVPFTNNGSEQDIRPLKIRMKVAGCLRTMTGSETFLPAAFLPLDARKQGEPAFGVLRLLHNGTFWMSVSAR